MTVQCVDCAKFNLRSEPKMARYGFGQCKHGERWEYVSSVAQRDCNRFAPEKQDTAQKRREWLEVKQEQHSGNKNGD